LGNYSVAHEVRPVAMTNCGIWACRVSFSRHIWDQNSKPVNGGQTPDESN